MIYNMLLIDSIKKQITKGDTSVNKHILVSNFFKLCVFMLEHGCVLYSCMWLDSSMWMHVKIRGFLLGYLSQSLPSLIYWDNISHWIWISLTQIYQLVSNSSGSTWPIHFQGWVIGEQHCSQFFYMSIRLLN